MFLKLMSLKMVSSKLMSLTLTPSAAIESDRGLMSWVLGSSVLGSCVLGPWILEFWVLASVGFAAIASLATLSPAFVSPAIGAESARSWKAVPARPYGVRGADRRLLDRAEQFAADEQWNDALVAITRLLTAGSESVVALEGDHRGDHYISLPEYCHRLLSRFPADALRRYRQLVDVASKSWYERGIAARDEQLLQRIVDENFCSSWGDDALFALGELALERGDYQAARNAWLRISPQLAASADRLIYPDTEISLATVQARLVLVSLREGDWHRAERELAQLRESYPASTGRLGGRQVVLPDHLAVLLKKARRWPPLPMPIDWPTFAASPQRTNVHDSSAAQGPYELLWSQPLRNEQLSVFPIVINGLVVYQDDTTVRAQHLIDGQPAFTAKGGAFESPDMSTDWFGQPWYTLTANSNHVFGITAAPLGQGRKSSGADETSACWCIDLQREGALAFRLPSGNRGVAFVGAPLVVENRLLIACRGNGQTARAGIACYDLDTLEPVWQRWLCQANTPASGRTMELATNLLAYHAGVIYITTNLGAIAAVRADDGQVVWLRTYERKSAELSSAGDCSYYRGPSRCIYYRGIVFALPTDSDALVAFEAPTGRELWRYRVGDPLAKLIGVTDGRVVLSNGGLQVCEYLTGQLAGENAEAQLVGWPALRDGDGIGQVFWPQGPGVDAFDVTEAGIQFRRFNLPEPNGANLLVTGDFLVVAGPSHLSVFRDQTRATKISRDSQTSSKE